MNIEVKVDDIALDTVVTEIIGRDEETGEPYPTGAETIGTYVATAVSAALRSR